MQGPSTDFYETLGVPKTATQDQIKQSYKKLALKYHPDKNANKQEAKAQFVKISEAYTVLNDPQKRKNYDTYGSADLEFDGLNFEQFMGDFDMFEEFLEEFLAFDTLETMFKEMNKSKGKKKKGRAKNRNKAKKGPMGGLGGLGGMGGMPGIEQLLMGGLGDFGPNMEMELIQAMMEEGNMDIDDLQKMMKEMDLAENEKELEKIILASDSDEDDEEELTEQQQKILSFGERNIEVKKVGNKKKKKKQTKCRLCSQKIERDEVLIHFSQNHMQEFRKSEESNPKGQAQNNSKSQKHEEEFIDY